MPIAPVVPTFVEQGYDYVSEAWLAVIGPKGMAPADVSRIRDALVKAFDDPEVKAAMAKQGNVIDVSTAEVAAKRFPAEFVKHADLVRNAGLKPQ